MKKSLMAAAAALTADTGVAHAHLGHLGELAGHGHWVGLGALGIAGAIAAAAAALGKKRRDTEAEPENGEEENPAAAGRAS